MGSKWPRTRDSIVLITEAIMEGLGWVRDGLVDIFVDVEHIPGEIGRPAPFMIFYAMTQLEHSECP